MSSDGAWLASGTEDGWIYLWDLESLRRSNFRAVTNDDPKGPDAVCILPSKYIMYIAAGISHVRLQVRLMWMALNLQ